MKYKIYAGLSGGFGGAVYQYTTEDCTFDEANMEAYNAACDEFESYEGLHGIPSSDDYYNEARSNLEESDYDSIEEYEDAVNEYACALEAEERESWIEYWVEEDHLLDSLENELEDE